MAWDKGALVAVMSAVDPDRVVRICRVVEDRGDVVIVDSDEELEGEAAIEHDFPTPDSIQDWEVAATRLRKIAGE
jgi:hypothetical protein